MLLVTQRGQQQLLAFLDPLCISQYLSKCLTDAVTLIDTVRCVQHVTHFSAMNEPQQCQSLA
jgi:hypothetical protein